MSVAWDAFLQYVLPDVPGCPKKIVAEAVRGAAIRLCEETTLWRATLPPVAVEAGRALYEPIPPEGARIVSILSTTLNGTPVSATAEDAFTPAGAAGETRGTPTRYAVLPNQAIRLNPTPDADIPDGLVVRAVLKPSRDSAAAEDFLYEDYAEVIAHGAKASLMEAPGRPWGNAQGALYHASLFRAGAVRAIQRVNAGFTHTSVSVKNRSFA